MVSRDRYLSGIIGVYADIMGYKRAELKGIFIKMGLQIIGILMIAKAELRRMIMKITVLKKFETIY